MNKPILLLISGLGTFGAAQAAVITFGGGSIPDPGSKAFTGTVSAVPGFVSGLKVSLSITGENQDRPAFNGDLYVTLQHGSGFAVLLNRPGKALGVSYGYPDNGMNVTFDDAGSAKDIHTYRLTLGGAPTGALTGTWSSDGRNVDPKSVLDTTPRTFSLGSFRGGLANGDWFLFVSDLAAGGNAKLVSWSLDIETTPVPVPEPAWGASLSALALGVWLWRRRVRPSA